MKFVILYSKLSNRDLQLPFLSNKLRNSEKDMQVLEADDIQGRLGNNNKIKIGAVFDEEVVNTKVKIMNLLDKTFNYFNSNNYSNFDYVDLSYTLILSKHKIIHKMNIKKYSNQYLIDISKKELYMIDDNELQNLLKSTQIFSNKEFYEWDWKRLEEILDIIEYRKDLLMDLFRQRLFKKLILAFMPSKAMFVNLNWNQEHFKFAAVGNKLFKLLSSSHDGIRILDTSPEDYYFATNKTWFEDVYACFDSLCIIK